jgi:UDP-N-acetylglucosamine--N-acetylmuramyl-(pentapeptide) pyrophosphoryl-undecaprenol N-acetylglucosamine transferase
MNDDKWQTTGDGRPSPVVEGLLWIGGIGGMEEQLVKQAGVPFESIPAAGVHGVELRALPGNIWQLSQGFRAARRILRNFRPDVVFTTGGYMAVPVYLAARLPGRGYPRPRSLLYIPDIEPGLALKTLARFADRIAVTTKDTRAYLTGHPSVFVTGYPTRLDLKPMDAEEARTGLGLSAEWPVLLVFGGSKGARSINRAVWAALPDLLREMQVVHITGNLDWPEVKDLQASLEMSSRYHPYPFLHGEMRLAFAASNLVLCRAGASTIGELPLFGLPAILVPYPYAWRYQQVNAQYLADHGAAVILPDAELPSQLLAVVKDLMDNVHKREQMRTAMRLLAQPEAAARIGDQLYSLSAEGVRR